MFTDYIQNDKRYIQNAMIHNKSLAVKFGWRDLIELEAGLDHWAQWGGISPTLGQRPSSLRDYFRIMLGSQGGEDAPIPDQVNALGNHLGREYVRINFNGQSYKVNFQYDMPYDDGKNIIQTQTFPDGVWSLNFSRREKNGIITDIIYEYIHTTWQSGDTHDRAATEEEMTTDYGKYVYWQDPDHYFYGRMVLGGLDDYYTNYEYLSGWTYYGRTIGLPLIIPKKPNEEGYTLGIANNRIRGHHIGIKGMLCSIPYVFKTTYTSNWGTYGYEDAHIFKERPWQLSCAIELELWERIKRIPMLFAVGAYGDIGKLYENNIGLTIRISTKHRHSFKN